MRGRSRRKLWALLVSAALLFTSQMSVGADSAVIAAEEAATVSVPEQEGPADPAGVEVSVPDETDGEQEAISQDTPTTGEEEEEETNLPASQSADPAEEANPGSSSQERETDSVSSLQEGTTSSVTAAPAESKTVLPKPDPAARLDILASLPSLRTISVQISWESDETEQKPESIDCTVIPDQSGEPVATCSLSEADASEADDRTIVWSKTFPDSFPVYSQRGDVISYRVEAADSNGLKYTVRVEENRNPYQNLNFYIPSDTVGEGDEYLLADAREGNASLYKSVAVAEGQPEKVSAAVISNAGFKVRNQEGEESQSYIAIRSRSQSGDDSAYATALNQITWKAQKNVAGALELVNKASGETLAYPLQQNGYVLFHRIAPEEMPDESAQSVFILTKEAGSQDEAESEAESLEDMTESYLSPVMSISRAAAPARAASAGQAPDIVGNIEKANDWQIVSGRYAGTEQQNKQGCDIDGDQSSDIFYQKNVIPTGVENEFRVYMGITKRMTWDELLAESDFVIGNSNGYHGSMGEMLDNLKMGHTDILYPGKTSGDKNLEATVDYYRGGRIVHTYRGWYHYDQVPKASMGTGFIYLRSLNKYLVACTGIALSPDKNGGSVRYSINLDDMAKQNVHFSIDDIVVDSVQDQMGSYITYEKTESSDGTTGFAENMLTWNPVSNGASGVQVLEQGGLTGYHYNIHQMVYDVHLKVEQEGFQSCAQNMNSAVGEKESYPVNQEAVLNCHTGSATASPEFQVPYVRGLLYDLEFQKVVKDSKIPLADISFTVTRQADGSTAAEQVEKSDQQTTDTEGWIKFHNLPWGDYSLQELEGTEGSFQSEYLDGSELKTPVIVQIGKVINGSALTNDHASLHNVDKAADVRNLLFLHNKTGVFENTPNTAKITIRKIVKDYDTLPEQFKRLGYTISVASCDTPKSPNSVYEMPGQEDTQLKKFEQETELSHEETVEYTLVVPKSGQDFGFSEIIPGNLKDRIKIDSVAVEKNENSTEIGKVTNNMYIRLLPGNDITITFTNIVVGFVTVKKDVENFQEGLGNDSFIIRVTSAGDNGNSVNTEFVLNHGWAGPIIQIRRTTTLNVEEILPKEYTLDSISIKGGGKLNGNQVTVQPGEDVEITVHNKYAGKPYFHASDAVTNEIVAMQ